MSDELDELAAQVGAVFKAKGDQPLDEHFDHLPGVGVGEQHPNRGAARLSP